MDHRSFRDPLIFSIALAVSRSRDLLRRIVREHVTDDARQQLAERVVRDLERSGFELDEEQPVAQEHVRRPRARRAPAGGEMAATAADCGNKMRLGASYAAFRLVAWTSNQHTNRDVSHTAFPNSVTGQLMSSQAMTPTSG
jgi:hypothetical protein